ncbi:acetyl-CoA acetyltransferase [Cohnella endophytica]|uniref:Acetyl-CoA acetyltransferase n=1 Tax=Cohnella endophytica TaxID=2419778 RepID=A0A494X9A0_9BACL|nr:acetyl-CoA acetyltransferase [Cohnella endophytica]RKP47317.1 acetyl-CoA acetyltransferase [Cohnella endophytica]
MKTRVPANPAAAAPAPLYKADTQWVDHVRKTRNKLADVSSQCMNRNVRVQTLDGHTYEGVVVGADQSYLHIMTGDARFFGPYASNAILTLVLYELLVITLLI